MFSTIQVQVGEFPEALRLSRTHPVDRPIAKRLADETFLPTRIEGLKHSKVA
jgi:hypothetical protein